MQPLNYQISEYDCVPTTILNALVCLIDRNRIPTRVIKYIYKKSLNAKKRKGTSAKAIDIITNYLNRQKLDIECKFIKGDKANLEALEKYLGEGYIAAYRVKEHHYILALQYESDIFYFFDPYWKKHFSGMKTLHNTEISKKDNETYFYKNTDENEIILFKEKK